MRRNPTGHVQVPDTLLHGTMPRSLPSIARRGLSPGQDKSLHETRTINATFLTDSMPAAMAYSMNADRDDYDERNPKIAVLVVKSKGLPLEPDYDDVDRYNQIEDSLRELGKELGRKVSIGDRLDDDEAQKMERFNESIAEYGDPILTLVDDVIYVEPYTRMPAGNPGGGEDDWLPDEVVSDMDGDNEYSVRQYLFRGTILPRLIEGVFASRAVALAYGLRWPGRSKGGGRHLIRGLDVKTSRETLLHLDGYPEVVLGYYSLGAFQG